MVLMIGISLLIVVGYYAGRAFYLKPRLVQGQKAAEISGQLSDGTPFALSALKGKYVLLDFWGTWCGPCLQSHPALVNIYQQFHGQKFEDASDFEIVSVAVENSNRNWQRIINEDLLIWPYHLLALNLFDSPVVKDYNVKQLPTTFLINPKGIIISVDPSLNQVAHILQSKMQHPDSEKRG
ncbi:MAG: TlpA disulfide reductase family protein [Saprospiraceae bacterium]